MIVVDSSARSDVTTHTGFLFDEEDADEPFWSAPGE